MMGARKCRSAPRSRRKGQDTVTTSEGRSAVLRGRRLVLVVNESQEGMTAQETFRTLLRDYVGPMLRRGGYKGSAPNYRKEVGGSVIAIGFEKSKWSDREHVDYRLSLRVANPAIVEKFKAANEAARASDRDWQVAPAGNWLATFPGAMLPLLGRFLLPETFFAMRCCDARDAWVTLRAIDPVGPHAEMLLDDIVRCVFPEIDAQLRAALQDPEPPESRPLRSEDVYRGKREMEYESTLERFRAVGIPTEPRDTRIQIFRG